MTLDFEVMTCTDKRLLTSKDLSWIVLSEGFIKSWINTVWYLKLLSSELLFF